MTRGKCIFHLPWKVYDNLHSGSQIRPLKMLQAFKDCGFEVYEIMGTSKERQKAIRILKDRIKQGDKFDFLYSESSTMPTPLTDPHHYPIRPLIDYGLFKFCNSKKIPVGLFYRDIHWRFKQYQEKVSLAKRVITIPLYMLDLHQYVKYINTLFLPSYEMLEHIPLKNSFQQVRELLPGTNLQMDIQGDVKSNCLELLYLGGVTPPVYNLTLLLQTVKRFSKDKLNLTVVCRKEDFNGLQAGYKQLFEGDNIRIYHKSGQDLSKLLTEIKPHIGVIALEPVDYLTFAVPIKLMDYISYGLPVIGTEGTKVAKIINEENIGWSTDYSAGALEDLFKNLIEASEEGLNQVKSHVVNYRSKNTWVCRAQYVSKTLIKG